MIRPNSFAFCGGAYGDEGKGRIVDEYVSKFAKKGKVVVYRDNGGANAGHTVETKDGVRIALHQLPSGVFGTNTTIILGKGMVIHPGDLVEEINQVEEVTNGKMPASIIIDEMAVLSLDTHRAFESVLKTWQEGGKGATGRGISPAYADVLLRHPLRMRDLYSLDKTKFLAHYNLYAALIKGLGKAIADTEVPVLSRELTAKVGSFTVFFNRIKNYAKTLRPYIQGISPVLNKSWSDKKTAFIFEKAQAIGLHPLWGVYPDVTASDTTFYGIDTATEGLVASSQIKVKAAVIKATYMSSVGTRKLPTMIEDKLAHQIREDANEYGATTKRPRDIAYLDLEAIRFFARVGQVTHLVLTHMDIVYPNTPIKVCIGYEIDGKKVSYRPDQEYLNKVKPIYRELKPWSKKVIEKAKNKKELPKEALTFLKFVEKEVGLPVLQITTGPRRNQSIRM